jgi:hypothetical protein
MEQATIKDRFLPEEVKNEELKMDSLKKSWNKRKN